MPTHLPTTPPRTRLTSIAMALLCCFIVTIAWRSTLGAETPLHRVDVTAAAEQISVQIQSFPDDMKARLEQALTDAGVDHTIETYPAKHGWVLRDTPVYDAAAAERHWKTLLALFGSAL